MAGMVNEPVLTVLATELPDTVPCNAELMTATLAGPPMRLPAMALARSINSLPTPVSSRNAPNRMNRNMNVADTPNGVPNTPLVVKYIWLTIWRTL